MQGASILNDSSRHARRMFYLRGGVVLVSVSSQIQCIRRPAISGATTKPPRHWWRSMTAMCSPTFGTRPRPKGPWRTRVHRPWSTFAPSSAAQRWPRRTVGLPKAITSPRIMSGPSENRPPHVKGLTLQINSQHTGSAAENYFAGMVFRNIEQ